MPRLRKPRALRPGGVIGIAAPGGPVDPEVLAAGEARWREAGFRIRRRDDLTDREGYLAGADDRRVDELHELVAAPEVEAIVCARGGYGCDRILHRLDAEAFRAARKPLVGYSDVTALLLWQRRCAGLLGFHGPMLERGADADPEVMDQLVGLLTGAGPLASWRGEGWAGRQATGRLVGGSLTLAVASLGTAWEIQTRGAILLLEDVGERPYRVDRMLQQLRGAGKLAGLAGIGLGAFTGCQDERYPEPTVGEVLREVLCPLGVPVVAGLPFGHVKHNQPWVVGGRATIDGRGGTLRMMERGVSSRR